MEGNRDRDIIKALTRNRRWIIPLLGYAVSIACMVYVYRGFNWEEQLPRIRQTPWHFVWAAVLCDIAVYCVQGWRWNELLIPVGKLAVWRSMQAIYIGLFANEVLPLRPGEVIRSFLQARWSGVPFTVVLSSVVIERLFDGIWLILGFFVTSFFVDLPAVLVYGSRILALILALLGAMLFGVDRQAATGYATLLFIVITVPLWVVGFVALMATKMKLRQLTEAAHQ